MKSPTRRTSELRRGRVSIPGARYFLTIVTKNRDACLQTGSTVSACIKACSSLEENGDWEQILIMVMHDHVHLLIILGYKLDLERAVSKWKTQVRRSLNWSINWQKNFYDHRLRPFEKIEAFGRYVFLNPYRAKLTRPGKVWPGWFCSKPEWFQFLVAVRDNPNVVNEWLEEDWERPWEQGS